MPRPTLFGLPRVARHYLGACYLSGSLSLGVVSLTQDAATTVATMYTPLLLLLWTTLALDGLPRETSDTAALRWSALYSLGVTHVLLLSPAYIPVVEARQGLYEMTFLIGLVALTERILHIAHYLTRTTHTTFTPSKRGIDPHD